MTVAEARHGIKIPTNRETPNISSLVQAVQEGANGQQLMVITTRMITNAILQGSSLTPQRIIADLVANTPIMSPVAADYLLRIGAAELKRDEKDPTIIRGDIVAKANDDPMIAAQNQRLVEAYGRAAEIKLGEYGVHAIRAELKEAEERVKAGLATGRLVGIPGITLLQGSEPPSLIESRKSIVRAQKKAAQQPESAESVNNTSGVYVVEQVVSLGLGLIMKGITHDATLALPIATNGVVFLRVNGQGLQIETRENSTIQFNNATLENLTSLFAPEGQSVSFADIQRAMHLISNAVRIRGQAKVPLSKAETTRVTEMKQAVQILSTALNTTHEAGNTVESMIRALDSFALISPSLGRDALETLASSLSIQHPYIPLGQLPNLELIGMMDDAIEKVRALFEPQPITLPMSESDFEYGVTVAERLSRNSDLVITGGGDINIPVGSPTLVDQRHVDGPPFIAGAGNVTGWTGEGGVVNQDSLPGINEALAASATVISEQPEDIFGHPLGEQNGTLEAHAPFNSSAEWTLYRLATQLYNQDHEHSSFIQYDGMTGKPLMTDELNRLKQLARETQEAMPQLSKSTQRLVAIEALVKGSTMIVGEQGLETLRSLIENSGSGILRDLARVLEIEIAEGTNIQAKLLSELTIAAREMSMSRDLYTGRRGMGPGDIIRNPRAQHGPVDWRKAYGVK